MKIGILIMGEKMLFNNGCNQQALFVYQTLKNIKNITCYLFSNSREKSFVGIPTYNINSDVNFLCSMNIVISLSLFIKNIQGLALLKKNNVKLVYYNCGNILYIYKEDIIFDSHKYIKSNSFDLFKNYSQFWVIPNYTKDIDFYKSICDDKTSVYTAPYVWNTDIVNMNNSFNEICYDISNTNNLTKYIIIAEANVQLTKNCLIPLLIASDLYKIYKNIRIIVLAKPKTEAFNNFLQNLDIYKNKLIEVYDRLPFINILLQMRNKKLDTYILSHQYDNPLNFLHLETLYLNYPLIHNSKPYKNAGYYYNTIQEGAQQLYNSFKNHSNNLTKYKKETAKVLKVFSPNNINNQKIYKKYLDELIINNKIIK